MNNPGTKRGGRNGWIELLRFVFALVIVMRHGKWMVSGKFFARGSLAVEFFFLVSGWLMAKSCQSAIRRAEANPSQELDLGGETKRFILRKYLALMPEFLIAWVIGLTIDLVSRHALSLTQIAKSLSTWIFELIPLSMAGFTGGSFHMGSWYISAMLLAMAILYPICRKHFSLFINVIAPLLAAFLLGILAYRYKTTLGPSHEFGTILLFRGLPRAIGEIALGAALFPVSQNIGSLRLTKRGTALVSVLFFCALAGVFYIVTFAKGGDIIGLFLMVIVVCLAFSESIVSAHAFNNGFVYLLGRISMTVYLCHGEVAKAMSRTYKAMKASGFSFPDKTVKALVLVGIYLAIVTLIVTFVHLLSNALRKRGDGIKASLVES